MAVALGHGIHATGAARREAPADREGPRRGIGLTLMNTACTRATPRTVQVAASSPPMGWWLSLLCGLLVGLATLCHTPLVAASATAAPLAQAVVDAGHGNAPTHTLDCAVDRELLAPSDARATGTWLSQGSGETTWLAQPHRSAMAARALAHPAAPGTRRALLQVFRI